jgi:hypothetical protein
MLILISDYLIVFAMKVFVLLVIYLGSVFRRYQTATVLLEKGIFGVVAANF